MAEDARPEIGYTGARFGGSPRRRTPEPVPERTPEPEPVGPAPLSVEWPLYRAEQDHAEQDRAGRDADPDADFDPDTATFTGGSPAGAPSSIRVRPYILTGGRTRAGPSAIFGLAGAARRHRFRASGNECVSRANVHAASVF